MSEINYFPSMLFSLLFLMIEVNLTPNLQSLKQAEENVS